MPLYDVTVSGKKVTSSQLNGSLLSILDKRFSKKDKSVLQKTVEKALDKIVEDGEMQGKLTWTKLGALVGRNPVLQEDTNEHLWEVVESYLGDGVSCMKFLGVYLMSEISKRDETWLGWRVTTDHRDPHTGKFIQSMNYWIDEDYIM